MFLSHIITFYSIFCIPTYRFWMLIISILFLFKFWFCVSELLMLASKDFTAICRLFVVVDCCKRAFERPPKTSLPLFSIRLRRSIVRYRWSCHRLSRPDDYYPRHIVSVYQVHHSDQFHGNRRLSAVTHLVLDL